jgi:hypothetical protein
VHVVESLNSSSSKPGGRPTISLPTFLRFLPIEMEASYQEKLSEKSFKVDRNELSIVKHPGTEQYIYIRVPFCAMPQSGLFLMFPPLHLASHGILLGAMLRCIGRPGLVNDLEATGGFVEKPDGDFRIHDSSAFLGNDSNKHLEEVLRKMNTLYLPPRPVSEHRG